MPRNVGRVINSLLNNCRTSTTQEQRMITERIMIVLDVASSNKNPRLRSWLVQRYINTAARNAFRPQSKTAIRKNSARHTQEEKDSQGTPHTPFTKCTQSTTMQSIRHTQQIQCDAPIRHPAISRTHPATSRKSGILSLGISGMSHPGTDQWPQYLLVFQRSRRRLSYTLNNASNLRKSYVHCCQNQREKTWIKIATKMNHRYIYLELQQGNTQVFGTVQ